MSVALANGMLLQMRLAVTFRSQLSLNVLHYQVSAVTNIPTLIDAAEAVNDEVGVLLIPLINDGASYRGVGAQILFPVLSVEEAYTDDSGFGTATGEALPLQVCGVISKRTAVASRSGRGRSYIPFPAEGDNDALGVPIAGYNTKLATMATAMEGSIAVVNGANTATLTPVVWSPTLVAANVIQDCIARNRWGTQRRRGDFGQTNQVPF